VPYEPGHFAQAILAADALRAQGVRVVLEGVGGDELFWPHAVRLSDSIRGGQLSRAWRQTGQVGRQMHVSRWRAFRDYGLRPLTPAWSRTVGRRALRAAGVDRYRTVRPWVTDSFAIACELEARADDHRQPVVGARSRGVGAYCDLLTRGYNVLVALPAMDSMDAALSIENRQPFFDRRLVEWSLALPDDVRAPDGRPKELLRRAMTDTLPARVRDRESKAVFDGLRREYLTAHGAAIAEITDRPALEGAGVLTRGSARALADACQRGDSSLMLPLLTVVKLELWYRGFLSEASRGTRSIVP
jgi:asparagine synthase (glutamine-hydrolysing)